MGSLHGNARYLCVSGVHRQAARGFFAPSMMNTSKVGTSTTKLRWPRQGAHVGRNSALSALQLTSSTAHCPAELKRPSRCAQWLRGGSSRPSCACPPASDLLARGGTGPHLMRAVGQKRGRPLAPSSPAGREPPRRKAAALANPDARSCATACRFWADW